MNEGRLRGSGALRFASAVGTCLGALGLPACFGSSESATDGGPGASDGAPARAAPDGGGSNVATMFVPDDMASSVYRYSVTPDGDPVFGTTFHVPSACSVALSPTGELFVASYAGHAIYRFLSPLGALTPNGMIAGDGLAAYVEGSTFVDGQMWVANYAGSTLVELAFDSRGTASVAGTVNVFQPM